MVSYETDTRPTLDVLLMRFETSCKVASRQVSLRLLIAVDSGGREMNRAGAIAASDSSIYTCRGGPLVLL